MLCDEKIRLLDVYVASVDRHAVVVGVLSTTTEDRDAFMKAMVNAREAKRDAEIARLVLEQHTETHGC